jgi:hypothetical protein
MIRRLRRFTPMTKNLRKSAQSADKSIMPQRTLASIGAAH